MIFPKNYNLMDYVYINDFENIFEFKNRFSKEFLITLCGIIPKIIYKFTSSQ